ncbi:MAG TPA: hypothetical protein VEJ38_15265 [Candidatus Acidoferrales bacterium]|nr:hypothetical protein [Candidatus Acidoferrales bacterium]
MRVIRILAICALLAGAGTLGRAEQNQVWTGTLVDASCYATDTTQSGNDHLDMKKCGTACLKMGKPAGIVTLDKKFYILLAPSPDIADYVGLTIRVTGKCRNGAILVDKLEVKHGAGWITAKLSTMM